MTNEEKLNLLTEIMEELSKAADAIDKVYLSCDDIRREFSNSKYLKSFEKDFTQVYYAITRVRALGYAIHEETDWKRRRIAIWGSD